MLQDQQSTSETFKTLDESIMHSRIQNRLFNFSRTVIGAGMLLGTIANFMQGREFNAKDPWISPWLGPLSFVWMMAFLHMFYVIVKIHLSMFTRIVCRVFYVGIGLILGKLLVVDWILKF